MPAVVRAHTFNDEPALPPAAISSTPEPGLSESAVDNGDWPPLRCVKTRPTSQGRTSSKGLNGRFFFPSDPNPPSQPPNSCPPQVGNALRLQGRNYWKHILNGPRRVRGGRRLLGDALRSLVMPAS